MSQAKCVLRRWASTRLLYIDGAIFDLTGATRVSPLSLESANTVVSRHIRETPSCREPTALHSFPLLSIRLCSQKYTPYYVGFRVRLSGSTLPLMVAAQLPKSSAKSLTSAAISKPGSLTWWDIMVVLYLLLL